MLNLALFQTPDLSKLTDDQRFRIEKIDAAAVAFAQAIDLHSFASADRTTALRHVLDAQTAAVRPIACGPGGLYRQHVPDEVRAAARSGGTQAATSPPEAAGFTWAVVARPEDAHAPNPEAVRDVVRDGVTDVSSGAQATHDGSARLMREHFVAHTRDELADALAKANPGDRIADLSGGTVRSLVIVPPMPPGSLGSRQRRRAAERALKKEIAKNERAARAAAKKGTRDGQ